MTANDADEQLGAPVASGDPCDVSADSVKQACKGSGKIRKPKRAASSAHPHFENADIDQVRYHRYLAEARRQAGITISLTAPKSGFLIEEKIRKLAYKDPIHVVKERGEYCCFGGVTTLEEARDSLQKSRIFPVLVYQVISREEVVEQVLLDQLCTLIHGCTRIKPLKKLIGLVVKIAGRFPGFFATHTKREWARYFCRSERSFTMREPGDETRG